VEVRLTPTTLWPTINPTGKIAPTRKSDLLGRYTIQFGATSESSDKLNREVRISLALRYSTDHPDSSGSRLNGRTRNQAEQVLATFFQAIGWSVDIRWSR
jgi:hypothetical protein